MSKAISKISIDEILDEKHHFLEQIREKQTTFKSKR